MTQRVAGTRNISSGGGLASHQESFLRSPMAEAQALIQQLLAVQSPDGGWPYRKGSSWTEPTAFVVLALQSDQMVKPVNRPVLDAAKRGAEWLLAQQKISGGWAPNAAVSECTSVTSIATLALLPFAPTSLDKALQWTAGQVYRSHLSLSYLLAKALQLPPSQAPGSVPWYPGTAGWVIPTALTALALSKAARERNRPDLHAVALQCCSYLLSRRCADNGWNHGGSKTRSEDASSYPETTGLALLALRAASIAQPDSAVAVAKQFEAAPGSVEGLSWIQMALQSAAGSTSDPATLPIPRTTRDAALRLLALSAREGRNVFLSA